LHDAGYRTFEIAAEIGIAQDMVYKCLVRAGRDPGVHFRAALLGRRQQFLDTWNAAADLADVARAMGACEDSVRRRARQLRALGFPLKRMPKRSALGQDVVRRFCETWNAAADVGEVARRSGLSEKGASIRAERLRNLGFSLKPMAKRRTGPRPSVARRIEALFRDGVSQADIARRAPANQGYVSMVLKRLRAVDSPTPHAGG
jgi:hypothetical protein